MIQRTLLGLKKKWLELANEGKYERLLEGVDITLNYISEHSSKTQRLLRLLNQWIIKHILMQIVFDVSPDRVSFALEVLRSLSFAQNPRPLETPAAAADATDYLLASPANADRLRLAYEQFDRGERIDFIPPAE